MRLVLLAATALPLDEILVARVVLEAGGEPATVSARLNLVEGDLVVLVTGPAGYTARCSWPWPVDSMPRRVGLVPGHRLVGAVPLLATDTSAPLFPGPGDYTMTARYDVSEGVQLSSTPVSVRRTPPAAVGRAEALRDRSVLQSLLSASALAGSEGLAHLDDAATATTRALSALARDRLEDVLTATVAADAGAAAEVATAVASVLPGGVFDEDPRRAAVERLVGVPTEARAVWRGAPA